MSICVFKLSYKQLSVKRKIGLNSAIVMAPDIGYTGGHDPGFR